MKTITATAVLAAALVVAPAVQAQETTAGPERGRHSISIAAQGDVGVGVWTRLSDRTDLGLNLALNYNRFGIEDDDQTTRNLRVEPAFKHYLYAHDGFAPYAFGSFFASTGKQTQAGDGEETITVSERLAGVSAAVGIDWFPARRLSIGGHVGLAGGVQDLAAQNSAFDAELEGDGWFVSTFNSGVVVHLYF